MFSERFRFSRIRLLKFNLVLLWNERINLLFNGVLEIFLMKRLTGCFQATDILLHVLFVNSYNIMIKYVCNFNVKALIIVILPNACKKYYKKTVSSYTKFLNSRRSSDASL